MVVKLTGIAIAGALGTLARYGLGALVPRWLGESFPWGTMIVNALGCFLFGFVWTVAEERALIREETRTIVLIGFLGAFTTYSSFAFETGQQLREAQWLYAAGNVSGQVVLGFLALFLGFVLARLI